MHVLCFVFFELMYQFQNSTVVEKINERIMYQAGRLIQELQK